MSRGRGLRRSRAIVGRWALGAAWRTLGEVYADWSRGHNARDAFTTAIGTFAQIGFTAEAAHVRAMLERLGEVKLLPDMP